MRGCLFYRRQRARQGASSGTSTARHDGPALGCLLLPACLSDRLLLGFPHVEGMGRVGKVGADWEQNRGPGAAGGGLTAGPRGETHQGGEVCGCGMEKGWQQWLAREVARKRSRVALIRAVGGNVKGGAMPEGRHGCTSSRRCRNTEEPRPRGSGSQAEHAGLSQNLRRRPMVGAVQLQGPARQAQHASRARRLVMNSFWKACASRMPPWPRSGWCITWGRQGQMGLGRWVSGCQKSGRQPRSKRQVVAPAARARNAPLRGGR